MNTTPLRSIEIARLGPLANKPELAGLAPFPVPVKPTVVRSTITRRRKGTVTVSIMAHVRRPVGYLRLIPRDLGIVL